MIQLVYPVYVHGEPTGSELALPIEDVHDVSTEHSQCGECLHPDSSFHWNQWWRQL